MHATSAIRRRPTTGRTRHAGPARVLAAALLLTAVALPRPARAAYLDEAGWGTLAVLANVGYIPAKLTYATLGGVTGGLAFLLTGGDAEPAKEVWQSSMGGTYVVTPPMLQGDEAIRFSGTPGTGGAAQASSS